MLDVLATDERFAETRDGWRIHLRRAWSPQHVDRSKRPLLIVPGYGMNGFIFGYHPRGTSLVNHLAEAGFEVWRADLRRQGQSRPLRKDAGPPSLRALAEEDVTTAIDTVLANTSCTHDGKLSVLGASLGGSIAYAHLALVDDPRIAALVAVGAPLRWVEVPPVVSLPFRSPRLVGTIPLAGTRRLAGALLPLLARRAPQLLGLYMNAKHVDLARAMDMIATVEDPHPRTNRDIARWMGARDMILRGVNVTEALGHCKVPLLVVVANRDGIVPERTATSAVDAWGSADAQVVRVGTPDDWYAHADLFVGDDAPRVVFEPIARWLRAH